MTKKDYEKTLDALATIYKTANENESTLQEQNAFRAGIVQSVGALSEEYSRDNERFSKHTFKSYFLNKIK